MKKFLAVLLSATMVLGLVACGGNKDNATDNTTTTTVASNEETVITPDYKAGSAGETLWNAFLAEAKSGKAPEEIANTLIKNPIIQFAGGAMAVEPGMLKGFKTEIKDFVKGAVYEPMMGSIAFIGYVFELADGADAKAFMNNLKENSNPAWNVCVQADNTDAGVYGNKVFFLMYPAELFGGATGGNDSAEAVIIEPEVSIETIGGTLWNEFKVVMAENPTARPAEIAFGVAWHEAASQYGVQAMEWTENYFPGIAAETFTGYKNAAVFMPMMGSVPFVGYIFELEEGADVQMFMADLATKADPAWNICAIADQVVIGSYNNVVFFLMCPASATQVDEL